MIQRLSKRFLSMLLVTVMILGLVPVIAAPAFAATSGTLTGLTDENIGLSFTGDADNAWSANGTTITGAVTSTGGTCSDTSHQSKLTIKNNKDIKATLSFDYAIEQNSGTIQVDGKGVTANGSYSVELDSGASKTVYIKSGSTSAATKITITNISLVSDVSVTVTFVPAENGTYSVDGKTITEAWENTQKATQAYELVATPDAGYMFLGWYRYNLDNKKCMSTNASAKLKIESDCSFAAKFVPKGTALFETGGQPFADLNDAVNYAKDNNKDKITLIADGAISGNYDIPAGITLLIPFDNAGTLYTDSPAAIRETPASNPFRTLTMTAGSSITVNGAMSIGGRYYAAGGGQQGRPTGDYGYIKMASGSSITVKNGGNLYAWGFISGDGSVTAESGATVYEFYQIADFRGGSASSNMGNKVFPFSQYFIQNIEVPLTLNAGATEKVFSGVYAMSSTYTTTINFIGSGGMFNIKSGSFTKDYDENRDRLILTVNGEAELNTLSLKLAGMSVNSASYVLPITNNITINIDSGSVTINQDTALLAGVKVNIAEGAGLTVASGKSVYVYDADEWNSDNFVWGSCKFKSVAYAPGKAYKRSNSDLTDAKINVDGTLTAIGAVYTTAGGADICSEGGTGKYIQQGTPGTQTTTYQYNSSSNSKEFTITPAKLRNADGTYFETATVKTGTTVNYYKDGGIWHVHTAVPVPAKDATCTEKGNTAGTKCSVCNKILSGVEEIPAKGHQWDEGSITTAPTCTEDGVKTFTCLVCDGTKTEKVEKKGHISAVAVRENEIKSTCTVKGSYDEVVYCKECGKELSRVTKTIDALGHTPGEAKRENVVEPSCMVDGRYEEVVYCSVCNDEISRVTKKIEATGHTPVDVAEVPATCTKPGTAAGTKCGVCGDELSGFEVIPPAGHQWDEGKVTTEPTCEGTGVKTFTCSNCQEKRYEDIPATGHQWDEGKVTTEPKCEEAGVKTYTCSVCDETKTEAIDATGHTPVEVPEVPATCTEPGKKAGTKCSVCDTILSGVEEIPAKGHQWDEGVVTKEPTCAAEGEKLFTCTVCKETKTEKIDKTNDHTPGEAQRENVKEATCTKDGSYDEVVRCKVCNKELSREPKTITSPGHQWDEGVVTKEPTCAAEGEKTFTCSVCKETKTEKIDKTNDHTPGEAQRENVKEATCTKDGSYDEVVRCKVCNEELSSTPKTITSPGHQWDDGVATTEPKCEEAGVMTYTCKVCNETKTEAIDATGHTPVEVPEVPATCTEPGKKAGTKCSVCDTILSGFEEIPAKGHQWNDGEITTAPTCTEKGVKTYTCMVCNTTKTEDIDATGHTPVEVSEVPATCTEPGKKAGTKCSECGTILSGFEEIPAKGHQWNDGEITTAPTCTEKGVKTYTCSVCDETKTEAIDPKGHTPVDVAAKDATCTEKGNTAGTKCSVCDTILSGVEEIPANGHQWNDGEITTAPTCTEKGVKTYTCSVCDETKTEAIDPKGHTPVDVAAKDATCTEKGNTAGTKCSVCNKILSGVEEIPAKGHTPGKAVKESVVLATCEAAGSYEEVVYCEVCKEELTRVSKTLPAMGHTRGKAVRENVIDSTCADEGSCDEVVYCEVCKKELSREAKVIEKKAHTPLDVAEVPATCTEPGTTAGTKCDVCGTILSGVKEIPANGHTEVIRNAKPATDTEDGYTGDVYCEVCNELLRNGEVIPATHVKITWIINGVKHETVCAKGEIPVYDGETPAKPETSRFTYEFKGWDKEIVAATENAEYTAEFTAIGKNGLCIEGNDTFWIKNGVNIAFPGLIRIADENGHIHYYYFAEDGKAVKNGNYKVNKNNGLPLPEYGFAFDSDGVIVHDEDTSKNGICDGDGDGSKFYYIDGVKVGEGLIKVGDYYYYARTSSGEIVRNRQYWITKTNELPIQQGIFDFDAEGRMIVTGFIHAFGATYYYDNGVLAKGFTKIGDDYYIFNASSGKMYSNAMMWVPDNEYGITGGMYEFDADGKMIRTGFITTGGYTYYYDNGVLAKGFTKIGDDYYFFNAGSGKMYRDATLWVADNAEYGFVGGMYYFGADGKMVLPDIENGKKSIVTINGKKYLTIDGAYAPTGLYEIDGNCYYVKAAGELAVGETVWVDNKNGLIPAKGDWRAFDAEGKLIHTGFVTGGDGYVYHYTDDVLSLGFTCIDGEYYLFNAGSGKMYRDANMWVGPNDYGIVGGMYYFDANGKMAR